MEEAADKAANMRLTGKGKLKPVFNYDFLTNLVFVCL